jgi:chromosome segregation ATPase
MEKQILEILLDMQKGLTDVKNDLSEVKNELTGVKGEITGLKSELTGVQKDLSEVKTDIKEIKETVNRIEISQTEDVIGILKMTKKKTDFEVDYLNNRLTEMDKRIYVLEKNMQN